MKNLSFIYGLALVVLTSTAPPVLSQSTDISKFKKNYEKSCLATQLKLHSNLKGVSEAQFRSHCECTATQLSKDLTSTELNELNQSQKRPSWFRGKEQSAAKACLMQEPKIQA